MAESSALPQAQQAQELPPHTTAYVPLPAPTGREVLYRTTAKLAAVEDQRPPRLWEVIVWKGLGNLGVPLFGVLIRPADPDLVLNRMDTTRCASLKVDIHSRVLSFASVHYGQVSLYLRDDFDTQMLHDVVCTLQQVYEYRTAHERVLLDMHTIGQQRRLLTADVASESSEDEWVSRSDDGSSDSERMSSHMDESKSIEHTQSGGNTNGNTPTHGNSQKLSIVIPKHQKQKAKTSNHAKDSRVQPSTTAAAAAATAIEVGAGAGETKMIGRACIYCGVTTGLKVHPYVPHNFNDQKVWFCGDCHQNWRTYRDSMEQAGELMLEGEPNEEICAICSAVPTTLIMCNDCPRSFCNECLDRLLTPEQQHQMNTRDIWRCFLCVRKSRSSRQSAATPVSSDDVWTSPPYQSRRSKHKQRQEQPADVNEDIELNQEVKRRKPARWTEAELYALGQGVVRYGEAAWSKVLQDEELGKILTDRTVESITIKWSRVSPEERQVYMAQDTISFS